jgi:hypothetical protein
VKYRATSFDPRPTRHELFTAVVVTAAMLITLAIAVAEDADWSGFLNG